MYMVKIEKIFFNLNIRVNNKNNIYFSNKKLKKERFIDF